MKYIAPLPSLVHFPTASIRLIWRVRQIPVKSLVRKFVMSKGHAAPKGALRDAGNARCSPRVPRRPQSVGSPAPITFVTFAGRISSASIPASNHVRSDTSATIAPPSADRAVLITVANAAARRRARHALRHVHGHALINRVRFHADQ